MTSFDQSLPMILNRCLDAVMPAYRELFARYDLTEQQWRIMRVLWTSKKLSSVDLSLRTLLPAPSLVGIIDRLEKKGLVSRIRSDKDRRQVNIVATPKGRALEKEVTPHVEKIDAELRCAVTDEDWNKMQMVLETISHSTQPANLKRASNG